MGISEYPESNVTETQAIHSEAGRAWAMTFLRLIWVLVKFGQQKMERERES